MTSGCGQSYQGHNPGDVAGTGRGAGAGESLLAQGFGEGHSAVSLGLRPRAAGSEPQTGLQGGLSGRSALQMGRSPAKSLVPARSREKAGQGELEARSRRGGGGPEGRAGWTETCRIPGSQRWTTSRKQNDAAKGELRLAPQA